MENEKIIRLRRIRNVAALGLMGELEYSECVSQIAGMAQGKLDEIQPRKAKPAKDRKERSGQDRSEKATEE